MNSLDIHHHHINPRQGAIVNTSARTGHSLRRRSLRLAGALALAAGALAACGSDDDSDTAANDTRANTQAPSADPADDVGTASEIAVTGAWARTSPMMASMGAAYMVITNSGGTDDTLLSARVDPGVAGTAEVHETRAVDDTMGDPDDASGTDDMGSMDDGSIPAAPMMEMVHIDRLVIPAGERVTLEPGGYHIMLIDLVAPLAEGAELTLTLTFEHAGEVEVTAPIGDGPT